MCRQVVTLKYRKVVLGLHLYDVWGMLGVKLRAEACSMGLVCGSVGSGRGNHIISVRGADV